MPMVVGMVVQGVATAGYVVALLAPFPEGWFIAALVLLTGVFRETGQFLPSVEL